MRLTNWMQRHLLKTLLVVWAVLFAWNVDQQADAQTGVIITSIRVEGTQRIEPDTVRSYMLVTPGDRYSPEIVDQSLKRLFGTGLFADVISSSR